MNKQYFINNNYDICSRLGKKYNSYIKYIWNYNIFTRAAKRRHNRTAYTLKETRNRCGGHQTEIPSLETHFSVN